LKRMRTRYPDIESPSFLGYLFSSALNLLSVIYAHVYFPTYSNGLKEVASYLGFRWSDGAASGLTALVWRSQWEPSHDPSLKEKLLVKCRPRAGRRTYAKDGQLHLNSCPQLHDGVGCGGWI
jgi:predicted RecB family nuclease